MLVDDELLTREDDRWVAARISPSCRFPRRSTRFSPPVSRASRPIERAILTAAAVEGAVFHRSAVSELARPALDTALEDGLLALVRRDLIRPEAPSSPARRPIASVTS